MPHLVEDAGGELSAGYVFKRVRHLGSTRGTDTVGGRPVAWELAPGGVSVSHPAADPDGVSTTYHIAVVETPVPSGGARRWWACRACGRRADALFLPADRDRLACRVCCRLVYRCQYAPGPVARRKERPGLWSERRVQRWEWSPAALQTVLVADRTVRRRL